MVTFEEFKKLPIVIVTISRGNVDDFLDEDALNDVYEASITHNKEDLRDALHSYMNIPSVYSDMIDCETFVKL